MTYLDNYYDQLGAYSLGLQYAYDIKPEKGVLCIGRPTGTNPKFLRSTNPNWRGENRNFAAMDLFHEQLSQVAWEGYRTMTRAISNLAELMTTDDAFTHVHMVFENYGSRRFIWMGHALDDLELHYMLDMVMEEMGTTS